MNYRIIIETEASGKKWYYAQRRYLLFFWCYLKYEDISTDGKIGWHLLENAEAHIEYDVNSRYENNQKKIVKREYIIR